MPVAVSPAAHFAMASASVHELWAGLSFRYSALSAAQYLASADWASAANGMTSDAQIVNVVRDFMTSSQEARLQKLSPVGSIENPHKHTGEQVCRDADSIIAFDKLTFNVGPSQLAPEDQKKVRDGISRAKD
jgi:hypothetical protein